MPTIEPDENGGPLHPSGDRLVVEVVSRESIKGRHTTSDGGPHPWVRDWEKTLSDLTAISDETDTDEVWSDVLRNLGIEPEAGGV